MSPTGRLEAQVTEDLGKAALEATARFVAAARDPSNFGLAKAMTTAITEAPSARDRSGAGGNGRMPPVKDVGEPGAGEPHARFDGGREETSASRPRPHDVRRLPPTRPPPHRRRRSLILPRPTP